MALRVFRVLLTKFVFPGKYSMIILGVGSALILIILMCGLFIILFCMKINKKTLPPADLIPKVFRDQTINL